jgi:carboxyl-terminal processing protease
MLVLACPVTLTIQDTGAAGVIHKSLLSSSSAVIAVERPAALALTEEQALVVDVWREVNRQFVDGSFNGLGTEGWKKKKLDAVKSVAGSEGDTAACYKAIKGMLASLDDPYTRFVISAATLSSHDSCHCC